MMWEYLSKTTKPIVLYGMGNGADKILDLCAKKGIPVAGVFASDEFARHNKFHDFSVTTYREAKETFGDMLVLVSFGTSRPEVLSRIEAIAKEQELLMPDLPVYGESVPAEDFIKSHSEEFQKVRSLLADRASVELWDNLIAYRQTGRISFLSSAQSTPAEAWSQLLQPADREHYLDLGAYTGDTVREFLNFVPDYTAITAVEPDIKNYQKLIKNIEGIANCRCIHAAVGNTDGTCLFSAKAGRGSAVAHSGREIPILRVDSLHPEVPFTLVNMDVEGNEAAAIAGMAETIRIHKPKLQIAAYHRVEDYIAIPLQVLSLRSDYRLYIRKFSGIPAWDVNFYFI